MLLSMLFGENYVMKNSTNKRLIESKKRNRLIMEDYMNKETKTYMGL